MIVGAQHDSNNGPVFGSARVFSGVDGSILYTFDGDSMVDLFGSSVSGAGDVNGDGFDDMIVGAPLDSNNAFVAGSARVFSGVDGSVLYTFDGDSTGDFLGFSVSGAGDVNGDGFADLIVGVTTTTTTAPTPAAPGSSRAWMGVSSTPSTETHRVTNSAGRSAAPET